MTTRLITLGAVSGAFAALMLSLAIVMAAGPHRRVSPVSAPIADLSRVAPADLPGSDTVVDATLGPQALIPMRGILFQVSLH